MKKDKSLKDETSNKELSDPVSPDEEISADEPDQADASENVSESDNSQPAPDKNALARVIDSATEELKVAVNRIMLQYAIPPFLMDYMLADVRADIKELKIRDYAQGGR